MCGIGNALLMGITQVVKPKGIVVFDDFNCMDNPFSTGTANTGQIWITTGAGVWGIVGNRAYKNSTTSSHNVSNSGLLSPIGCSSLNPAKIHIKSSSLIPANL